MDSLQWGQTAAFDSMGNLVVAGNILDDGKGKIYLALLSTEGDTMWTTTWTNPNSDYDAAAMVVTSEQRIYVAGVSYSAQYKHDILVLCYDFTGNLEWSDQYSGGIGSDDYPTRLKVKAILDAMPPYETVFLTGTTEAGGNDEDWLVRRYDQTGSLEWSETYDHAGGQDIPVDFEVDNSLNVYVVGGGSEGTERRWVMKKYDDEGMVTANYTDNASGTRFDIATSICMYGNTIYVCGNTSTDGSPHQMEVRKFDNQLSNEWTSVFAGDSAYNEARFIRTNYTGNIYVGGLMQNTLGGMGSVVVKFDSAGDKIWYNRTNCIVPQARSEMAQMAVDADGSSYIALNDDYNGLQSITVYKVDSSGFKAWYKRYPADSTEPLRAYDVKLYPDGLVYVTGLHLDGGIHKYCTRRFENHDYTMEVRYVEDTASTDTFPSHAKSLCVARFQQAALIQTYFQNEDIAWGRAEEFLNDSALSRIQQKTGYEITAWKVRRIMRESTIDDTMLVTRQGDTIEMPDIWTRLHIELPSYVDEMAFSDSLSQLDTVIFYAQVDHLIQVDDYPNDDVFTSKQYSLFNTHSSYDEGHINVKEAWEIQKGKSSIRVGVIDHGIDYKHLDFCKDPETTIDERFLDLSKIKGGWDYITGNDLEANYEQFVNDNMFVSLPYRLANHGTSCAGIIGAISNNGKVIAGIAGGDYTDTNSPDRFGVSLYDFRTSYPNRIDHDHVKNPTWESTILSAVEVGCKDFSNGGLQTDIFNMSISFRDKSPQIIEAMSLAYKSGVVMVVSRGNGDDAINGNLTTLMYPASLPEKDWVITVSGSGADGYLINDLLFSNHTHSNDGNVLYDGNLDVIAPAGQGMIATTNWGPNGSEGSKAFGATSAAAPHVAGVAALLLSEYNTSTEILWSEDVQALINYSATDKFGDPNGYTIQSYDAYTGWGLLNAGKALKLLDESEYLIQHLSSDNNTTWNLAEGYHTQNIKLEDDIVVNGQTLKSGDEFEIDVFEVTGTVTWTLPSNTSFLWVWPRGSSSGTNLLPYPANVGDVMYKGLHSAYLEYYVPSSTQTSQNIFGYVYLFKKNLTRDITFPSGYYYPASPTSGNLKIDYTILTTSPTASLKTEKPSDKNSLTAYMNNGELHLRMESSQLQPAQACVVDIQGRQLFTETLQIKDGVNEWQLALPDLQPGVYIVQVQGADEFCSTKFLITK